MSRTGEIQLSAIMLAEQHDEWIEGRRYLGLEVVARARAAIKDAAAQAAAQAAAASDPADTVITESDLPELEPAA